MEERIVPADKKIRKWAAIALTVFTFGGAAALYALTSRLDGLKDLARTNPAEAMEQLRLLIVWLCGVNALFTLPLGFYLAMIGIRTLRGGQYPPDGMRVLKDTRLRTGGSEKPAGIGCLFAALLILSTNFVTGFLLVLVQKAIVG